MAAAARTVGDRAPCNGPTWVERAIKQPCFEENRMNFLKMLVLTLNSP